MAKRRLVVVDVETTGVTNNDRICEVAAVVLTEDGEIVDEYDTLIDPQRDVGPTSLHGITASMVSAAPSFEEAAAALAARIDDAILVAHNLAFDRRMLSNEYDRLGATLVPGEGICTLRLTGERLNIACPRYGIALDAHHRALADARATAKLLICLMEDEMSGIPAAVENLTLPLNPRTLRREATGTTDNAILDRLVAKTRYPSSDGAVLSYLDALDWVLDDLVVTSAEAEQLQALACDLGLDPAQVQVTNERYLESLVAGAMRDGIITTEEHKLIDTVANALGMSNFRVPEATELPRGPSSIPAGARVCFTGSAVNSAGHKLERAELEAAAAAASLQPISSVTKRGCDLLVAADPASSSGKAKKARSYGIAVISIADFCEEIGEELWVAR